MHSSHLLYKLQPASEYYTIIGKFHHYFGNLINIIATTISDDNTQFRNHCKLRTASVFFLYIFLIIVMFIEIEIEILFKLMKDAFHIKCSKCDIQTLMENVWKNYGALLPNYMILGSVPLCWTLGMCLLL